MLVRAAVHEKRVCSQPVSQLPPFLSQAFSAFFYTVDFIQTVMGKAVHLPSDLKDAAETICATSWSEVGSSGTAGRRGLLHVGHCLGSERSPWRGLCVLVPLELGKGGAGSYMRPGEAPMGMRSTLARQMQPCRASGHRNKAWALLA